MDDLNTALGNYAVACQGRAERHRADAEAIRSEPKSGWDDWDRGREARAREHDRMAARWDFRATEARQGRLAVHCDAEGLVHQREFQALHACAAGAFRAVTLDDDNKPFADRTAAN